MKLQFQQVKSVTSITMLEIVRQPACLLLTLTAIAFIAILPLVITHTLGETGKLVRDSALAIHFVCGLLLGSFAACSSLAGEIRRGTAASILSKPISREVFFLSKFCGITFVMLTFSLLVTLATIMSVRVGSPRFTLDWSAATPLLVAPLAALFVGGVLNYFARRPFLSTTFGLLVCFLGASFILSGFLDPESELTAFGAFYDRNLVPASMLVGLAVLILAAIASTLATRLDIVPTLSICSVIFLLGLVSDHFFGRLADTHLLSSIAYSLLPNWQHFWTVDALNRETGVSWQYVLTVSRYALVYLAGVLCLGMFAFRNIDIRS